MARIVPLSDELKEPSPSISDSNEFSTSREDQPPHPIPDGIPEGETAEASRLSAVTAAGASDVVSAGVSSSAVAPLHDGVINKETTTKNDMVESGIHKDGVYFPAGRDNATLPVPIVDQPTPLAPATPIRADENDCATSQCSNAPELRRAAAREREGQGEAKARAKAIEYRLQKLRLEEELDECRAVEARKRNRADVLDSPDSSSWGLRVTCPSTIAPSYTDGRTDLGRD